MIDEQTPDEPMSFDELLREIELIHKLEKQKLGFYEAPTELIKGCVVGLEKTLILIRANRQALELGMRPKLRFVISGDGDSYHRIEIQGYGGWKHCSQHLNILKDKGLRLAEAVGITAEFSHD